jgi:hypothetical protein
MTPDATRPGAWKAAAVSTGEWIKGQMDADEVDVTVDGAPPPVWRERGELLALLLLAGVIGLLGQSLFTALAYNEEIAAAASAGVSRWDVLLPVVAQGGTIINSVLLAIALAVVVLTPGAIGRLGRVALNASSVLGVLVAALALLGIEEALRVGEGGPFGSDDEGSGPAAVYTKVAAVCVWLPSFAIAGAAAWTSWRTLNEIGPLHPTSADGPAEPGEPAESAKEESGRQP